jgi:hypothetical protein
MPKGRQIDKALAIRLLELMEASSVSVYPWGNWLEVKVFVGSKDQKTLQILRRISEDVDEEKAESNGYAKS